MPNAVAIFPLSNSVAFSPAVGNGVTNLRQAPYAANVQGWQTLMPYVQKVVNTDMLTIMVHSQYVSGGYYATLHVCDHNKTEISGIDLGVAPFFKGVQSAIDFADPVTGGVTTLLSSLWSFSFSDLADHIPVGGVYYLRYDDKTTPAVSYYSEPLLVSNTHPDTLLYQFTYNTNNAAKNIVIDGWRQDFPDNTKPYAPVFGIRAEGYVLPSMSGPKGINIGYFQQGYNPVQIKTQQKRFFDLHLGDISLGVPWYMLEMVTEALMADNVSVLNEGDYKGYAYVLYNASSGGSLSDIWKVKGSDVNPLLYASCNVMQRDDRQAAFLTPTPAPVGGRVFMGPFGAAFA